MNLREHGNAAPAFQVMAKAIGPICNLQCSYCFYLEKEELYPGETQWRMSPAVLETFIRQEMDAHPTSAVSFVWQGGEPTLLGVDYFARVIELQKKYAHGRDVGNALQTNGTLLDDEWCVFLARNHFLVGISMDGPWELHDRYRVDHAGAGSFDRVVRGLEFLKKHRVEFNTLTAVHRGNSSRPLEIYRFLKDVGSRFLQFIPIVERVPGTGPRDVPRLTQPGPDPAARVSEWSVDPPQYGQFLCAIFDEWVRHDVGKIFVQLFDVALESWLGLPQSLCVFRETCGESPVLEHSGDLYACDHYVYPDYRIGNIMMHPVETLAGSARQCTFGREKRDALPESCRACPVLFACNGECPKHRFLSTSGGEPGLNYLCAGYRSFFQHIDRPMRYMAEELRSGRPPANVMRWLNELESGPHRRNAACYCGSGKKYKYCHGH